MTKREREREKGEGREGGGLEKAEGEGKRTRKRERDHMYRSPARYKVYTKLHICTCTFLTTNISKRAQYK